MELLHLNAKQQALMDKQVAQAVATHQSSSSSSNRKNDRAAAAAVLVLLLTVQGQPSVLFTRRAAHLSQHAAEISFPGGHFEGDADETLTDTAIREAVEELYGGNNSKDQDHAEEHEQRVADFQSRLRILGHGTPLPSIRGTPVTPVLAVRMSDDDDASDDDDITVPVSELWPGDRSEVDLVFSVTLRELLDAETVHTLPNTRFGFASNKAPVFPTAHGKIWGLTAYILRPVLHQLLKPVFFPEPTVDEEAMP